MSRNVLLAILALAVPAALFVVWQGLASGPTPDTAGPAGAAPAAGTPASAANLAEPAAGAAPGSARDELVAAAPEELPAATRPADSDPAPVEAPPLVLRGHVLGPDGVPLAGVPVRRERRTAVLARSDGAGRFELELPAAAEQPRLVGRGDGFAPLRVTVVRDTNREDELVVLSAPAVDLSGHVESLDGERVADARVSLHIDQALQQVFPLPLDSTTGVQHEARTDAAGAFALEGVPALEGAKLRTDHPGYTSDSSPAPTATRRDLVLRVVPRSGSGGIDGIVLLPSGEPVEGARVRFGRDETRTAGDGSFQLPLRGVPEPDLPLAAGHREYGVAFLPDFGASLADGAPPPVTLVLPGSNLAIEGSVVDASGQPLAGWLVSILDGTPATRHMAPPVFIEDVGSSSIHSAVTGQDGTFELDGLLERSYTLRAYERNSLRCLYLDPVPAGTTGLEIRVPGGGVHERVAGTVVSRAGLPVEGARVSVGLITSQQGGGLSWDTGASTVTDDEGRFALADVPAAHVHLDVGGESVVPDRIMLDHDAPVDDLRVEVARRCHFRVTFTGEREGLMLAAVDAAGEPLTIYRFQANGWTGSSMMALNRAEGVCTVSEDAAAFVLRRGGEIVARRDVVLSAEDVNEIELAAP